MAATYSVRVGSPWIDQTSQTTSDVLVRQVIVNSRFRSHRLWSWVGQANNIALLQLEKRLKYSKYIWPICLPGLDYEVKDQSVCTVTGWGLPRAEGESEPPRPGWLVWERTWAQAGVCRGQMFLRHRSQEPAALTLLSFYIHSLLCLEAFISERVMAI